MEEKLQIAKVKLGNQGLEVSRLGFGCGGLSGIYNTPLSHEVGCSVIKDAFSKGVTLFDTSDIYGDNHDNEIMVGKTMHSRFVGANLGKNKLLYARVANLAAKHGCSSPQLALAWVLHQGDDIIPIPGTTKIKNLDDNIGSLEVKLSLEDLKEVSAAVPIDEVNGEREFSLHSHTIGSL
ncbi:Aldo/keto reductase [Macleaya cordata]|uniref:Aldo/keto reductase n=1 Tax=Macleaya cordata TaxID=56857 RepID=A0A200QY26_MACCD|nr:Aldo/keto reductase [Macleaya cordata]